MSAMANLRRLAASIPKKGSVLLSFDSSLDLATISLSSPQSKNALSPSMMVDFVDVVAEVRRARPAYLILEGSNGAFCSGADIGIARDALMSKEGGRCMQSVMSEASNCIRDMDTISFAAVDGAACGGGAELTTCCDFRVLGRSAGARTSRIEFVQAKMGVTTGWGGGRRLCDIVGHRPALRFLLGLEEVSADNPSAALRSGLVDWVSPEGTTASAFVADMIRGTLGGVNTRVALSMKKLTTRRPAGAVEEEEEAKLFESHWNEEPHRKAFDRAMEMKKKRR